MAVYGDLTYDSRVRREAAALARAGYEVSLLCLDGPGPASDLPDGVGVIVHRPTQTEILPGGLAVGLGSQRRGLGGIVRRIRLLTDYVRNLRAWGRAAPDLCGPVDVWHLHDLTALIAVAPVLGGTVPVVYDAHELFLESGTAAGLPAPMRRFLRKYERRLVSRAFAVVTVNDALADILDRRYRPRRVVVVHNCPDRWTPPAVRPDFLREAAGIPADEPVILHHGSLGAHRGIEQLMDAILEPGLERAHLVLLGPGATRDQYAERATDPAWQERVHVLDPVPPAELMPWVTSADVGAMPIQRSTLNHFLATPNKLFECLTAGVPVVASDFPAMRAVVMGDSAGPLGVLCRPSDVGEVASALRSILDLDVDQAAALRRRCMEAAQERWNWEHESSRLIALYDDLFDPPDRGATASSQDA
jgi:glycosyltransferase involved in cell wall biosynthesis